MNQHPVSGELGTPTPNDEPPSEYVERPRKHRFALVDFLAFITSIPVCVGVVAAIEFTASNQSYEWFGIDWYNNVRHFLIDDVGVPSDFVTGYVSFAIVDVPAWICYAVTAFILGLLRSKWTFTIGVAFILSIFIWDLTSDYFSGLHGHINLRLVSLLGVVVAAMCFAFARRIRGRSRKPDRKNSRILMAFNCVAIVAMLAVAAYGWWLVELSREAGLEVQEWFSNAKPE